MKNRDKKECGPIWREIPSAPGERSGRRRNYISEISKWRWNYEGDGGGCGGCGEWWVVLLSGRSGATREGVLVCCKG